LTEKDTNEPAAEVLHLISGNDLLAMLDRVAAGEDPEWVYMEMFVNGERIDNEPTCG
jgi:hypothetical protein